MTKLAQTHSHLDRTRLDAVIDPLVRAHGGEVVDVDWKQEPGGWVLRVFVEKLGSSEKSASTEEAAVSLDMCAAIARDVSPALDVADFIPHRYHLEVGSPGIERPLKSAKDYARFVGKKAKVRVREPVDGQKVVLGILEPASRADCLALREGQTTREIPFDQVTSGNLVFEFGPAPKPGKRGKQQPAPSDAPRSPKHHEETSNSQRPHVRREDDSDSR